MFHFSRLYPCGICGDELAPVGLAACLGLFGSVFRVVDILTLVDGMADRRTHSIGSIKKLRVFVRLQYEMHHFGDLFLRGVAVACDGLLNGFGRVFKNGNIAVKCGGHSHMSAYATHLAPKGELWLSGFYEEDCPILQRAAEQEELTHIATYTNNDWRMIRFIKQ